MTAMTWACALSCTVIDVKHELDLAKMKVGECFYAILGTPLTRWLVRDDMSIDHNFLENLNFQNSLIKIWFNNVNEDLNQHPNDFNEIFNNKTLHRTNAAKKKGLYKIAWRDFVCYNDKSTHLNYNWESYNENRILKKSIVLYKHINFNIKSY